ncbi:DUF983 domain-containing protein [Novosphingobium sp. MW5]|nr:DUF983 domain-containing protein [Novosphingobium sp. MW5]
MCPRCGKRTLFGGLTNFAETCRNCGLNFAGFNVGDGPAAFLTLIIGALIVGLALWFDAAVRPPLWLHAVLWIPLTAGAVIFGLRAAKAWLLDAEYRRKAAEVRNEDVRSE